VAKLLESSWKDRMTLLLRSTSFIYKRLSNKAILKVFMKSIPRHAKILNS